MAVASFPGLSEDRLPGTVALYIWRRGGLNHRHGGECRAEHGLISIHGGAPARGVDLVDSRGHVLRVSGASACFGRQTMSQAGIKVGICEATAFRAALETHGCALALEHC
ncbi:hypothetical protein NDU88_006491 [Pleurodeles waltl]|uniref:Uncharacterized protein n=1 Tax=Pleurodeles waltl TaxID=8319 RepID=A0AAV7SPP8_PLEWA|nr:hypothetical protein NDU88_006491 [Pleurodeles waltl]